ncbi:MAG: DUF559 domain-containing protein [Pseudomonadota bacterium]
MIDEPGTTPSPTRDAGHLSPKGRGERGVKVLRSNVSAKVKRARSLRRNETEAERYLWSDLRNRNLNGYRFSRQVPIGPYFADFLYKKHQLIVEVDGSQHADNRYDAKRTDWLNRRGFSVLRVWNHDVFEHRNMVLENIVAAIEGKLGPTCQSAGWYPAFPSPLGERWPAEQVGEGDNTQ